MDCFHLIGVLTLLAAPFVLLTNTFKMRRKAPEGY